MHRTSMKMSIVRRAAQVAAMVGALAMSTMALAGIDAERRAKADAAITKAMNYLRSQQDAATGGWSVPPAGKGQPNLPAITGLVLNGFLLQPGVDASDPAVASGVRYILGFAKDDGGIYDSILPSYNTAICLSALARVQTPEANARIKPGQDFLRNQQWGTATPVGMKSPGRFGTESPAQVGADNANYGGIGYGNHGRPDISNLAFAIQAWHDTGLPTDDPGFQRAITFLQRCQMMEKDASGKVVNDLAYAKGSKQGGFIYATGREQKSMGEGESNAGLIEESMDDGTKVSRLRAYGSVTYAGFKSYVYAGLSASDPRVQAVLGWIGENYTLAENPSLGTDGVYYYTIMFARAMNAFGQDTVRVTRFAPYRCTVWINNLPADANEATLRKDWPALATASAIVIWPNGTGASTSQALAYFAKDAEAIEAVKAVDGQSVGAVKLSASMTNNPDVPQERNWRHDVIDQLSRLQNADGSFRSLDDRWMENNPVLITAYALIALQEARQ